MFEIASSESDNHARFSCYTGRGTTLLHIQLTEKPRAQKCDD